MLDTFPSCYCTETEKRYHIEKLNELRGSLYSKSVTFSKSRTFILSSHPELTGFSRANSLKTKFTRNQPMLFSSVQFSCSVVSDSLPPRELQHSRSPCPSPTPGVYPDSCPLSRWCYLTISCSVIPFFSHSQSFPASGSFQMSQIFASGGQSIGVSPSTSVLPMNAQDWSPIGWTGWTSLQSKGLSRVFSNTTVQKHWFFNAQLSL